MAMAILPRLARSRVDHHVRGEIDKYVSPGRVADHFGHLHLSLVEKVFRSRRISRPPWLDPSKQYQQLQWTG